tara:strand:- start:382 stop:498 length:117 start_codon:yes stop_codon:yes gene_type:complete
MVMIATDWLRALTYIARAVVSAMRGISMKIAEVGREAR